ncbi:MAG: transcription antitermination factor NusB [Nitrospirae bacterium]|nr:MAG: transcription antitermination factor NusB [Nitrospirota bacterium]
MKRRRAREYALQILYQQDIQDEPVTEETLRQFWQEHPEPKDLRDFTEDLLRGTNEHIQEIDALITEAAEHWRLERMSTIDRNILRFATYELLYRDDIPAAVTINEAVEITKKYSDRESPSFVNGVLNRIRKKINKRVH